MNNRNSVTRLRVVVVLAGALTLGCGRDTTVRIDWVTTHQIIDGFGASSSNFVAPLSDEAMDFFFTPSGIGLTLLRTRLFPGVADCDVDKDPGGVCLGTDGASMLSGEVEMGKMAIARGGKVWSSSWSPPGSMKSNNSFSSGGAMIGTKTNYEALARILAGYVTLMKSNDVPIYALSPQNEPDISKPYPSATWTPRQIHDFIPYLHAALRSAGTLDTKIMVGEESPWNSFVYAREAMDDGAVAPMMGIIAGHGYDYRNPSRRPTFRNFTTQHIWQTEVSTFEPYDGGMDNGLAWAERIHYFLSAAQVNAFHYWYLSSAPNARTDNEGLTDRTGAPARRAYVMGNWSKFVRPGWHEVAVPSEGSMLVSAFQNAAADESVIVAVNRQSSAASANFEVGSAMAGNVTPWITSEEHALAAMPGVAIADGKFTFAVPSRSVVTFVGQRRPN